MIGTIISFHGATIEEHGAMIRVCLVRPCAPGVVMALREAGFRGPVRCLERIATPRAIFDAQAIVSSHYGQQVTERKATGC